MSSPSLETAISPFVSEARAVKSLRACERDTPADAAMSVDFD